jgi:hypothetical protein
VVPLVEKAKAIAGDAVKWFNFFDKLFLLALLYFEEKKVDYVVLETGLGGRYLMMVMVMVVVPMMTMPSLVCVHNARVCVLAVS